MSKEILLQLNEVYNREVFGRFLIGYFKRKMKTIVKNEVKKKNFFFF